MVAATPPVTGRASRRTLRPALLAAALLLGSGGTGLTAQLPCPRPSLPAYSHNDYLAERPLSRAIELGYRGVEADVFLVGGELRLGHDRKRAAESPTLRESYLEPLRTLFRRCEAPAGGPFLLFVEIKEESRPTYDALVELLARYPDLLLPDQPPVRVVLVGWHPAPGEMTGTEPFGVQHRITSRESIHPELPGARVRLLSLDYGRTMGRFWVLRWARDRWYAALREAARTYPSGLPLRVHNVPVDPGVYSRLLEAGVDLIGTEALEETHRILVGANAIGTS